MDEFIKRGRHYITPLLLDENGFIMAYEDTDYIQLAALLQEQAESEKTIFELIGREHVQQVRDVMQRLKHSHTNSTDDAVALQVTFGEEKRIVGFSYPCT